MSPSLALAIVVFMVVAITVFAFVATLLATALAVTPGGLGVNEWTFAAALTGFGVDLETATQCALVNRVLVMAAALLLGAGGFVLASFAPKNAGGPDLIRGSAPFKG